MKGEDRHRIWRQVRERPWEKVWGRVRWETFSGNELHLLGGTVSKLVADSVLEKVRGPANVVSSIRFQVEKATGMVVS